jgi:hypothetical protein
MRKRSLFGVALPTLLFLLQLLFIGACAADAEWRPVPMPWTTEAIGENQDARAVLNDGSLVELENARIVLNPWGSYLAGDDVDARRRQIELENIQRLDARQRRPERFSELSDATQLLFVVFALVVAGLVWNNASTH